MAVVDVQFRANANFADLIAQVNAANLAVKNLNNSFATMGRAGGIDEMITDFTRGLAASRQFTTETVRLRSEAERFGEALHKQRLSLREYYSEYKNFVNGRKSMITELARQQTMLERSMVVTRGRDARGNAIADVVTPTGLDNSFATKAAVARKELQIMNKVLNDGANSLINWGKNTQWAGRQLTVGLTVPLTLLGGAAAKLAYDLDQQMTRVIKVYGNTVNTVMNPAQIKALRQDLMGLAGDLAKTYGQAADQTLGLAADFAAAGKQGEELMVSVTQTTRLATLGEVDRAEAMKATLAIQTAFKSNTKELADSINFLNAVENQTNTSLNDLVEAIPKAGPVVKGLGGDIKDLSLLVVAMREGGIPAAEAANALKSGLASLINPTKAAREMMKGFNIDIDKVTREAGGKLIPMLLGFQAELDKLDEFSRQQVIEKIFGKYQFARIGALFANLNREGSQTREVIKLMGADTQQLAQIADRELGQLQQSISGQFNRALEQTKVQLAGIGEGFLELATKGLTAINWILEKFDSLPDVVKTGLGGIATLTAIIGPVIMTTGVLGNLLGYIVKGVAWFKNFGKSGTEAFSYLTKEEFAAKEAGDVLEKSFYNQTKAAAVLDAEINKLIESLNRLAGDTVAAGGVPMASPTVMAEKMKEAVVAQAGPGLLINNANTAESSKDARGRSRHNFQGAEFSHFYPASELKKMGPAAFSGFDPGYLHSAGSLLPAGGLAAAVQKELKTNMVAGSIVEFSDSMADLDVRRQKMLKEMAGDNKELAAMMSNLTAQERALLLPTKEAFKSISLTQSAFWKTLGEDQNLARISKQTIQMSLREGLTYEQAWGNAFKTVMEDTGGLLQRNIAVLEGEFDKIVASTATMQEKVRAAVLLAAQTEAAGIAAIDKSLLSGLSVTTGVKAGSSEFSDKPTGARSGTGYLLQARQNEVVTESGLILPASVAEKMDGAADKMKAAAAIDEKAAEKNMVAADEELVASGENAANVGVAGGSAAPGTRRGGRFRGFAGSKFGKGIGAAAGVGLLSAGMSADSGLGDVGAVAGGAFTGAMIGSIFPGIGTAVGAAVGGLAAAIPVLVNNIKEASDQLQSVGQVGETAFQKLGAVLKDANTVSLIPLNKNLKVTQQGIQEILDLLNQAPEGSADSNFIKLLKGEDDKNSLKGFLEDKIVQLRAAGVEAQKVNEYIQAALMASGRMSDASSFMGQLYQYSTRKPEDLIKEQMLQYRNSFIVPQQQANAAFGSGINQANFWQNGQVQFPVDAETMARQQEELQRIVPLLANISATKPPTELMNFLSTVGTSALPLEELTKSLPDQWKFVGEAIKSAGGTSNDALMAISLSAQGVQIDLDRLSSEPFYIKVVYDQYVGNQALTSAMTDNIGKVFTDRYSQVQQKIADSTDKQQKTSDAAIKAQQKHIDAIKDQYDQRIDAEKKKQKALNDAQDAEQRRLDRQKQMNDLQVSYNEAISSGNFGAAALVKNQMQYTRSKWATDDKNRVADDAAQARIDAIEKERDAAIKAEQAKLDAMRENQKKMTDTVNNAATVRARKERENIDAAKAEWDRILKEYPNDFEGMAKELQNKKPVFKAAGIDIGTLFKSELEGAIGPGTAANIFKATGGKLAEAPWGLVGEAAAALALGGSEGERKYNIAFKNLTAWANSQTQTPAAGSVSPTYSNGKPVMRADGGYISGPGHGRSDDVEAKLSNGEFVMTNAAVNYYGKGFMDAVNKRRFASGGLVDGMSTSLTLRSLEGAIGRAANVIGQGQPTQILNDAGATNVFGGGGRVLGTGLGAALANLAVKYIGVPYSYTGQDPQHGWGCAPFVRWVYNQFGYSLPGGTVSNNQYNGIKNHPSMADLSAGDLVFFKYANGVNTQNRINHVGMYIGGGNMVHAANPRRGTIVSGVDWGHYVGAARPVDYNTKMRNYARGGLVANIMPGEFMVKKSAVDHYGTGMLNAINQQTYHEGGLVTKGGPKHGLAYGSYNEYNFNINGDQKSAKEIAREVITLIETTERRKRSNR